jgi:hypothetical protein
LHEIGSITEQQAKVHEQLLSVRDQRLAHQDLVGLTSVGYVLDDDGFERPAFTSHNYHIDPPDFHVVLSHYLLVYDLLRSQLDKAEAILKRLPPQSRR